MKKQIKRVSSIIGTAGHVDHGKSTLVTALTGIETDRLAEEKRRGVSIELGFAYIDLLSPDPDDTTLYRAAIVDVPGHERFLNTMLRGATGIGVTLLVVAANDGIMPQTVEHLDILHCLGVSTGVVVISKCDTVTKERITEVEAEVQTLLKGTSLEGVAMVRYSSVDGIGLEEIRRNLADSVFKNITDMEKGIWRSVNDEFFRLPIDRSFHVKGFGTVVTGSVASGRIITAEGVETFPGGRSLKVRGIESHGTGVESVERGQRAALNLSGIGYGELSRGTVLTSVESTSFSTFARSSRRLRADVSIELLPNIPGVRSVAKIKNNSILKLHHLTGSSLVRIRFSDRPALLPGEHARARLLFTTPLLLLRGDVFILRDPATNSTVGGGRVAVPYTANESLPAISSIVPAPLYPDSIGSREDILMALGALLASGGLGFELSAIAVMLNVKADSLLETLQEKPAGVTGTAGFSALEGYVVSVTALSGVKERIKKRLKDFHLNNAAEEGLDEESVFKTLLPDMSRGLGLKRTKELLKSIVNSMIKRKELVRTDSGLLGLPEHKSCSANADVEAEKAILELLDKNGLKSTPKSELEKLPFSTERIDKAVKALQKNASLAEIKRGGYISASVISAAEVKLKEFLSVNPSIVAKEFRDLLGCGRKLAIEILEYFDRLKVTLRRGDERILR